VERARACDRPHTSAVPPWVDDRQRRFARNEGLFREVNEAVRGAGRPAYAL